MILIMFDGGTGKKPTDYNTILIRKRKRKIAGGTVSFLFFSGSYLMGTYHPTGIIKPNVLGICHMGITPSFELEYLYLRPSADSNV